MRLRQNWQAADGMIGTGRTKTHREVRENKKHTRAFFRRRKLMTVMLTGGVVLALSMILIPADESQAFPGRTGGTCQGSTGNCHPLTSTQFLTVSGFPTGSYIPGNVYRITVSIADGNGATGENHMDFIVSAGTVSNGDANVVIVSSTEARANTFTVSSWSFDWTAPASGAVSADAWGVYGSGNGKSDPYDRRTLSSAQIPEFPTLIVPIVGALGLMLIVGYHKRSQPKQQ